ncbi:sensor histidine kinase [Radiobacillus sp. PE A8.2]|uniref:sensor histidine kinase n=1 Tax=Radiobacillus sp. PE A8.2 TaxID=3380349 RepID=UPI003890A4C5
MLTYFINKSIRFKLLSYFIIVIILCIFSLSFFGGNIYKESLEEEANLHAYQMIDQVWSKIDMLVEENEDILHYLTQEDVVLQFLEQQSPSTAIEAEVKNEMKLYEDRHSEIAGILLVSEFDNFTSNEMLRVSRDSLTRESWYIQAIQSPDSMHLISNPIGRNIKKKSNFQMNNLLTLVKAIKNPATGQVIGVVLMDLKLDFIKSIIESIKFGESGFVFIMNNQGEVVYSPVNSIVYRIHPDWLEMANSAPIEREIENNKFQILYNTIPDIGWKVVGVFSLDETTYVVTKVQLLTLFIAFITLIIGSIISLFFASTITKPVNKLKTLMADVEEGRLDLRFNSKFNDEIGQLGQSYNKMLTEVQRLIQLVYMEQKSKREAELKILQAQIKPHFLYNTLDTIQWMAIEYEANKIVDIVSALTTLFRIGLNKGNEFIKLKDEVEHVNSYLIIQMTRYESKLSYEIDVDDKVKDYQVLKLILQPLVENAIYHGIRNKRGKGHIYIHITDDAENLFFYVKDTGKGIKEEKLKQLNRTLKNIDGDQKKGFGLSNVNERIKLSYGDKYGLEVFSEYDQGTTVKAILPIIKN